MNTPNPPLDFPTIEDIARYCGDGTAQALELQRPVKPSCPKCKATGWHKSDCPTQEKHS